MQTYRLANTSATWLLATIAIVVVLGCLGQAIAADANAPSPSDYRHTLAQQLQQNASPRDWALASQLLEDDPTSNAHLRERARILQKAVQAAPNDRIVLTLWANLPVPVARGRQRQQYAGHWLALTRLEPLNGVAWMPVVDHAWKSGNARATEAALARMASAESYNEHLGNAVAAWRDVFRRFPPPPSQVLPRYGESSAGRDAFQLAFSEAVESSIPPFQSLFDACRPSQHARISAQRLRTCGTIGRLMMRRSQTLIGRLLGVAILRASHAGKAADIGMIRTVAWQAEQYAQLDAANKTNPYAKQNHLDLLQRTDSEMQAIQYELAISGIALVPPDGWKQTVNGKQIEPLDDPSAKPH